MARRDKINYYLDLAEAVAHRSTCLRRHYGAVIVSNDQVISTGYSGAPRGRKNCCDLNRCIRDELKIPRGERYELCRSVHAEANAILKVARSANSTEGATLYCTLSPCLECSKLIIQSGIKRLVYSEQYRDTAGLELLERAGIEIKQLKV